MTTKREKERRAAVGFWFAVERMLRRRREPPPTDRPDDATDDGESGSGVPRRPPDSSGSAAAAAIPPDDPPPTDTRPRQLDEVQRRWDAWLELPYPSTEYPPGSLKGEVAGIDLALLDGDGAAAVSDFLDPSLRADPHGITRRHALAALEKVVPLLSEPGRAYFAPLLELLRLVQAARDSADEPPL